MAAIDPEAREQLRQHAEGLLRAKYGEGRTLLDPVRVMHAVRTAAEEQVEVPAGDVLAALTLLDEARAALDTLERGLTRAARARSASWQEIADHLGLTSRSSAKSRYVRLQRDAASYRGDRYPELQRADRARDRAADEWARENERRLRGAVADLTAFNDTWPSLTTLASAKTLLSWTARLDGPALAAKLHRLHPALSGDIPAGAAVSPPHTAAQIRNGALALLNELASVRNAVSTKALSPDSQLAAE
ncbi:hypothetical protein ACFFSH_40015 [Streptomyces filamentosus]|uniref:DNA-binding protein n=1 Tax=Streptomyces filamentosus TaxID=67294 RepID=A0A919BQ87_STRFL|nr:hypothetical protein [Streptomyces filamentosus]GHG05549.1 hypothetical protein GCM10017667_40500 [Streptomyces filamentosus]